ncbi:hypothetical protein [uncultured Bradyrhizobium sp.]|uniref:hypothetical protein n=1 Tax=uncultured Bradyrhizobium sp. TaxID=199684 RepID=UPI0035CACFA3
MPITRSNIRETSFSLKMREYLAAHASGQHEQRYGWKNFRVLTITTDRKRAQSMADALDKLPFPLLGPAASLFFFATHNEIYSHDPLGKIWYDGNGRESELI